MRLQLKIWLSMAMAVGLMLRSWSAWAQSSIKYKRLTYDEGSPGITVDEDNLEVLLQLDNQDQLSFTGTHDVVTGASPTGVPENTTVTGASTTAGGGQTFASFKDERWAFSAGYSPLIARTFRLNTALHYSEEQDYLSHGATLGATFDLNKKNTTISPSVTYFDDLVKPSNDKPNRGKTSTNYVLEISQILNTWNVLNLGLLYTENRGYLTDPYKQVQVGSTAVDERRPSLRVGEAAQLGWRTKPFEHQAFDFAYRYYMDDWGIHSHTATVKSLSEHGEHWLLEFFYRYYTQNAADFWSKSFSAANADRYRSSDLRLSPFQANTIGATGILKLNDSWWLEGSVSRYLQSASKTGGGAGESAHEEEEGTGGEGDIFRESEGGEDGEGGGFLPGSGAGSNVAAWIYSLAIQFRF